MGKLLGLVCLHVDDFFCCGKESFFKKVISCLKETFEISKEAECNFNYLGLNILQNKEGISVDQNGYIDELNQIPCSVSNKESLSTLDFDVLRSSIGQLSWVAKQTRPDIAFEVCKMSVGLKNATGASIKFANKTIRKLQNDKYSMKFPNLGSIDNLRIVVYSDAAFANMEYAASQGGFIVFLEGNCGKRAPIVWSSRKLRRVARSTSSAEAMSLLDGLGYGLILKTMLKEIFGKSINIPVIGITDSKNLKDTVYTTRNIDDKRHKIDICALRDMLQRDEVQAIN